MDGLTAAYQSRLRTVRDNTGHLVKLRWDLLGSYNDTDVDRFVAGVTPIVQAGQKRAIALSSAYTARKLHRPSVGITLSDLNLRNGVSPKQVYRRPFVDVWKKLKDGDTLEQAVTYGGTQAQSSSLMDVSLAVMATYVAFTAIANAQPGADSASQEIVAWRRIADPGCCDFCQMLDGVHTGPDEPQPLHNRCGCTAEPITRAVDPDPTLIGAGSTHDDVTIQQHGELGPVITQKGDTFTTLADIVAADVPLDDAE